MLSRQVSLDTLSEGTFTEIWAELESRAADALVESGVPSDAISFARKLDMRYLGQGFEVEVALPGREAHPALPDLFSAAYAEVFGMDLPGRPVEIVNWKIEARGPTTGRADGYRLAQFGVVGAGAPQGIRKAWFPELDGFADCPVYDRYTLAPGSTISGPALIEERESTCVVGPQDIASVDSLLNLIIEIR